MKVDVTNCELIATANSEKSGRRAATRLSLFYKPDRETGKLFVSQVEALYDGNVTQCHQIWLGSLDRALEWFKESALTVDIRTAADDWWERNEDRIDRYLDGYNDYTFIKTSRPQSDQLAAVMAWLYPGVEGDLSKHMEADFGIPSRTVRDAVLKQANGEPLSGWAAGFIAAMQFFDRADWKENRA